MTGVKITPKITGHMTLGEREFLIPVSAGFGESVYDI